MLATDDITPADLGLALPAAWEPHQRMWMAWPCRRELWRDGLTAAQAAYARAARAIAEFEPVVMVARPEDISAVRLACGGRVETMSYALDDSWMRDIAPHYVVGAGAPETRPMAGVAWSFNAWGNKYQGYAGDAAFARFSLERAGLRVFAPRMVLEGGAIAANGAGVLLTIESCLLNPNRNPEFTKADIEEHLAFFLGVRKVVWLGAGLEGDETDGHVDNIACFCDEKRVLLTMPARADRENWERMDDNRRRLDEARTSLGEPLEFLPVPMPRPHYDSDGHRLTLSYLNFVLANGGLIVPAFDDPADDEAAEVLAEAFPERRLVQIEALPILAGGGGLHCITHEEPMGVADAVRGDPA